MGCSVYERCGVVGWDKLFRGDSWPCSEVVPETTVGVFNLEREEQQGFLDRVLWELEEIYIHSLSICSKLFSSKSGGACST